MSDDTKEKSGPNRIMLAALALVIGLAGGGAAIYFLVPAKKAPSQAEQQKPAEDKKEEAKEAQDSLRVTVRRFSVPLITRRGNTLGYVWVDLDFVVDGPNNQSLLSARLPRVKNAMLKALHASPTAAKDRPGALDLDDVERRMRAAANAAAGEDVIHKMYVTNVQRAP